jgi:TfoX/Sxy family transcriptional regulator of competence genes
MAEKDARVRDMEMALRAALSNVQPNADVTVKKMFGGAGFWVNGVIFAAWFGGALALKLPPEAAAELRAIPGAVDRSEMGKYVEVPPTWSDDPALLQPWVARSVAFVLKSKKH